MKKTFKTLALFIGLSLVAVSCQKELYFENDAATENTDNIICVTYTIDGLTLLTIMTTQ